MHIRHSSTNHKLIESNFVSCVAYTIFIWSHSEHILQISFLFICDARLRKYQHLSLQHNALLFSQESATLADLFICDSRLHKYNQLSKPTFWSACVRIVRKPSLWKPLRQCHHTTPGKSTTEACSNESSSTERTRGSHCDQIYNKSLFQRKQAYWTHWMIPLRTTAICCSWQPTITTHSTKLW